MPSRPSIIIKTFIGIFGFLAPSSLGLQARNGQINYQRYYSANAPEILEQPSNITIPNGSPAVLFCRVTGNPQPAISWWRMSHPKNNSQNDDGDSTNGGGADDFIPFNTYDIASAAFREVRGRHFNTMFDASKTRSALRIDQVRRRHAGIYRCQAALDDTAGNGPPRSVVSSPAFINVLDDSQTAVIRGFPRAFIGDGPTKSVELNSRQTDVILPCDVDGDRPLTVKWLKESIPLETDQQVISRFSLVGSGSLKIHNVEREDGGHYECLAINMKGTAFSNRIRLDVVLRRVYPYFVNKPPQKLTARVGEHVNISCTANGSPFPYVAWYRNILSDSSKPETAQQFPIDPANLFESHLIIQNIHQSANFTCRAQSELGVISATTFVDAVATETVTNLRRSFTSIPPAALTTASYLSRTVTSTMMNGKIGPRVGGDDWTSSAAAPTMNIVKPPRKIRVVSIGERNAVLIWDGRTYEQVVDYFTIYYRPVAAAAAATTEANSSPAPLLYVAHITAQRHEIVSLEPGTAYEAYVVAEHLGHVSEPSERVAFETMKDGAPRDVRAHAVSSTAVRVNWLPSLVQGKSLRGYDAYYTTTFELQQQKSDSPTLVVADEDEKMWRKQSVSVRDTATLLTGLQPRTLYKVKVRPIFWPEIHGPFSAAVVVETQQGVPGQPRDVSVQVVSSSPTDGEQKASTNAVDVELFWKPPNSDTSILRYDVHVYTNLDASSGKTSSKPLVVKPVSAYSTSTILHALSRDEQYDIRVMAIGRDGAGPPSEPIIVDFSGNGENQLTKVGANSAVDWAADTAEVNSGTAEPPRVPMLSTVEAVSSTSLNISWQASLERNSYDARSFRIYAQEQRNNNPAETEMMEPVRMFAMTLDDVPDGTSGYAVTDTAAQRVINCWKVADGLQDWRLYKVWLVAVNSAAQESEQSKSITARTMESVPGAPKNLHFTLLNSSTIRVFWEPPVEPQRANIRYYMVYYGFDDEISSNSSNLASYEVGPVWVPGDRAATVTGLTSGRRYQFQVVAFGAKGDGERSQTMLATLPKARPSTPEFKLTFDSTQLQAHLKWFQKGPQNHHALTGSVIIYGPTSAFENFTSTMGKNSTLTNVLFSENNATELRRKRLQPQETEMIVAGLERGEQYTFQLYTLSGDANDASSTSDAAIQTLSIPEGVPDGPPTNIRYQFDQQSVLTFYWDPPRRGKRHGIIRQYEIEVLEQDSAGNIEVTLKRSTDETHLPHTKLKKHFRYLFKVAAATRLGTGPFSPMIHVDVPLEVPKPPANIQATAVNWTSIEVWWTPIELASAEKTSFLSQQQPSPLRITGYKVYHSLVSTAQDFATDTARTRSSSGVFRDSLFPDTNREEEEEQKLEVDSLAANGSSIDNWHAVSVVGNTAWHARIGGLIPNATYSVVLAAQTDTVTGYLSQPVHVVVRPSIVPRDFRSTLVGSNFVRLEWLPPPSPSSTAKSESKHFVDGGGDDGVSISYYKISCEGTRTFYDENGVQQAPKVPPCVDVNISNATNTMISHLVPFTDYKFSLKAVPVRQPSYVPPVVHYMKSLPEVPDVVNAPEAERRVAHDMYSLRIRRSSNKRGSLAYYWLVVVPSNGIEKAEQQNLFSNQPESMSNDDLISNSNDSARHLVKPYIAAKFLGEEQPTTPHSTFVLGDSNYYGGFYNRALTTSLSYRVFIRVLVRQAAKSANGQEEDEFVSFIDKSSAFSPLFSTGENDPNSNNQQPSNASPTSAADAAVTASKSSEGSASVWNFFASIDNVSTLVFIACAIAAILICCTIAMIVLRKCCWHWSEQSKQSSGSNAANDKLLGSSESQRLLSAGGSTKSSSAATAVIVTPNGNSSSFRANGAANGLSLYTNPASNGFKPSYGNGVHHAQPAYVGGSNDMLLSTQQQQQHASSITPSASSTVEAVNVQNIDNLFVTSPRAPYAQLPAASCSGSGSTQSTNIVGSGMNTHNNIEFQFSIDAAEDEPAVTDVGGLVAAAAHPADDDSFVSKLLSLRHQHVPDPLEQWRASSTASSAALSNYAPIRVEHLESYIQNRRQEAGGFSQEFQCVATTRQFTWLASSAVENRDKNRYANVIAYDHSRVILDQQQQQQTTSDNKNDYINANFCDGYRQRNAYIATQGPMSNTICDFWRMIWQQHASSIVMLTKLDERMRPKCTQYWPQRVGSTETYYAPSAETGGLDDSISGINVTLENVDNYAFYVIRKFSIQPAVRQNCFARIVWQYQFTAWPDHGVPQDATPFLMFVRRVQRAAETTGPLVVHCSAGVGRTGAFIVIDAMLRRLCARDSHLDIFGCVCMLREQRNFMVQTDEQYGFVYDAILEASNSSGMSDMSPHQLACVLAQISASKRTTMGESSRLKQEFAKLKMRESSPTAASTRAKCERALTSTNKYKNRDLKTLPYDANSVYLLPRSPMSTLVMDAMTPTTRNRNEQHSDYINASFIDGYRLKRAYIATQLPLRTTVSDFWRMVCEQNSNIIVMLLNDDELASPSDYCHYWPSETSERFDSYVIYPVAEYNLTCYVLREFKVTDSRDGCSRTVRQFQFSAWNDRHLPVSTESLIEFIGQVHKTKEQFGQDGPITVHCSNGAGRTGLLIALSAIIERIQYEKRIDIFSTAQLMLMQRMNTISSLAHYEFLYNAASNYLQLYE